MAGRGEYQKQMMALMAAANAKNLKFEDILPDDTLEHFQGMTELKAAREVIKELGDRGTELQAANETLRKNLYEKQKEIDDFPKESKALKVELQQAERQITLHKKISEDSRERAERYQRQLKEIADKQQTDVSAADKVERLQTKIEDQQILIAKLIEEHRATEAMFAQLRESDLKELAQKDKQLAKKNKKMAEKDELLANICKEIKEHALSSSVGLFSSSSASFDTEALGGEPKEDSLIVQEKNIELLQQNLDLEEQMHDLKEQLYRACSPLSNEQAKLCTHGKSQFSAAIISEIKPLNRFYKAVFQVVNAFAMIFQATSTTDIPSLSNVGTQLDMAKHALDDYVDIKNMMRTSIEESDDDDMDQIALRNELDLLATSAIDSHINLEVVHMGFWTFLNQLSDDPKMLSNLNGALCDAERVHVIDLDGCD